MSRDGLQHVTLHFGQLQLHFLVGIFQTSAKTMPFLWCQNSKNKNTLVMSIGARFPFFYTVKTAKYKPCGIAPGIPYWCSCFPHAFPIFQTMCYCFVDYTLAMQFNINFTCWCINMTLRCISHCIDHDHVIYWWHSPIIQHAFGLVFLVVDPLAWYWLITAKNSHGKK